MRLFLPIFALMAVAAAPAFAQGTPQQRAACEADAYRLCDAYVPDAIMVERCLRANAAKASPACRAEMGLAGKPGRRR